MSEKLTQFAYAHTIQAPLFILENFVLEFIEKLRLETEDHEMPSSRQSINMYKLLYARFMKKGRLTYEDLLEVAEVTSKLNNQFIARRLAWQILRYPHRRMPIATRRRKIPFFTDESERIDRGGTGGRMEKLPISKKESDKEVKKAYEKVLWLGNEYIQKLLDSLVSRFFNYTKTSYESQRRNESSDMFEAEQFDEAFDWDSIGSFPGGGEEKLFNFFLEADFKTQFKLKGLVMSRLKKIGLEFENIGSKPRYIVKPYEIGDDPCFIDEIKSFENIFVDLGKTSEDIEYNDFLIRKKVMRPKTVIFLQDISNSMYVRHDTTRSINYTVIALIPLIHALRRLKFGLAFFESNTHIVKELFDEKEEDQILSTLLFLATASEVDLWKDFWSKKKDQRIYGGTVPNTSLIWAKTQLNKLLDRSIKVCFIFSDFMFTDSIESEEYQTIKSMIEQGIKVVACVSPLVYSDKLREHVTPILSSLRRMGCEFILTSEPRDFLQRMELILDRF